MAITPLADVLTARQTARELRTSIEERLGSRTEVLVTSGPSVIITFRQITKTMAVGITDSGDHAIVSLGDEINDADKHPTILLGGQKSL